MDAQDFDVALGDLETRVDRLRALYENWFRGYEKAEPAVARKEVERKVYAMRKELPRNTALRFRYHQLYQRYTTLSNYWQRTARQIEEGTYRLQHMRIRRRNELAAERGEQRQTADPREPRDPRPDGFELDMDEPVDIDGIFAQVMLDDVEKALTKPGSHAESELPPAPRHASRPRAMGTFARPRRESNRPTPELPLPSSEPRRKPVEDARALAPTQPAQFFDDQPPVERRAPAPSEGAPISRVAKAPPPAPKVPPPPPAAASRTAIPPRPPTGAVPAVPPRAPPPPLPSGRTAFGLSSNPADVAARIAAGVPARAPGVPAPAVNRGSAPSAPTITVGGSHAVQRAAPPPKPFAMKRPSDPEHDPVREPSGQRSKIIPGGDTVVGRPPLRSPLAPDPANLNDQRLKHLHEEFNSARKRNNEGDVRFETVVHSIQKMLPELEKKHAGKRIDFEVVVKDGRVGLKPKAT